MTGVTLTGSTTGAVFTSLTGATGVCIGPLTVTGLTSGPLITGATLGWAVVFCTGTLVFTSLFVTTVLFCISFNFSKLSF